MIGVARAKPQRAWLRLMALWMSACTAGCAHSPPRPAAPSLASARSTREAACPSEDLDRQIARDGAAPVIVLLDAEDASTREAELGRVLAELGQELRLVRRYASLPGFAGIVTIQGLQRLRAQPLVRCVQLDHAGRGGAPDPG